MTTDAEALNHNLELPVSRIPTDILSRVFSIIRDDVTDILFQNPWLHPSRYQHFSWIVVTQVCHPWREVAINTPMLWTNIILSVFPGSHQWAKEMLCRSEQCPLAVIADFTPVGSWRVDPLISIFGDMKASFGRCRVLNLRGVGPSIMSLLSSGSDFNELEFLTIAAIPVASNVAFMPDGFLQVSFMVSGGAPDITVVPCELISGAKSLQSLQIHDVDINLHNPSLVHLTRLALYRLPNATVHGLVAALSKMSVLKVLHLMNFPLYEYRTEDIDVVTPSKNRVFLESIEQLFFASDVTSLDLFLQHIQVSPACEVRLKAETDIRAVTEFGQIFSWTSQHFQPPQSSDDGLDAVPQKFLQSFSLYIGFNVVEVRGFHEVVSHEKLVDGSPIFEFIFGFSEHEPPEALLCPFLASLPLSRIVFLEVSNELDSFNLYPALWMAFAQIKTIKTIFLDANTHSFFPVLHSPDIPYSNLASVTVNEGIVRDEEILEILRGRANLGAPLKEILFSNKCGLPPDTILRKLREVVEHVGIHQLRATLRDE